VKEMIPELSFSWNDPIWNADHGNYGSTSVGFMYNYENNPDFFKEKGITVSTTPKVGSAFMQETGDNDVGHTGIVTKVEMNSEGNYVITLLEQNWNKPNGLDAFYANEVDENGNKIFTEEDMKKVYEGDKWGLLQILTKTRTVTVDSDGKQIDPQNGRGRAWNFVEVAESKYGQPSLDKAALESVKKTLVDKGFVKYNDNMTSQQQDAKLDNFLLGIKDSASWGKAMDALYVISNIYYITAGKAPDIEPLIQRVSDYLKAPTENEKKAVLVTAVEEIRGWVPNSQK
jgi:hypothetical protein